MSRGWLAAAVLLLAGCVERTLEVRTDPPGARVYLDRTLVGRTPLSIPFVHYGVREVGVQMDGYADQAEVRSLWPPWYEFFPLDFVSECLMPFTLVDRHVFEFTLVPLGKGEPLGEAEEGHLLERAEELRGRLAEED